jgi:hypothetical protein
MSGYVNASAGSTSVRTRLERERYEREEREAAERKLKPLLDEQQNLLRQVHKGRKDLVRQFYGRDLTVVRDEVKANHPLSVDEELDVPEGRITEDQWNRALNDWTTNLTERTGITLNVAGLSRVVAYAVAQLRAGKNMSTLSAFDKSYNRLFDSGAFGQDEVGFDPALRTQVAPAPAPEPTPAPTVDEVLAMPTTKENERLVKEVIDNEYFKTDVSDIWYRWLRSLYDNFNGFSPSEEDKKYIVNVLFVKNNWNRLDPRSYDLARRAMCNELRWPASSLLTDKERSIAAIEDLQRLPNESDWSYRRRCQQAARG